jgi:hypothetical protein
LKSGLLFLVLSLVSGTLPASAQEIPKQLQQQMEDQTARSGDLSGKDDEGQQRLDHFLRHPLDMNRADRAQWQMLGLLTDLQIDNILRYRSAVGKFISTSELQAVPGLDLQTCRMLAPMLTITAVDQQSNLWKAFAQAEQRLLLRCSENLERSRGYNQAVAGHYLGSPAHLMSRFTGQFKSELYYGAVADKDAGEQFFRGAQKLGFDFYSAHFFLRNRGNIKALALGDYTVNMGQGLVQWQSFASGKTSEVLAIKRQGPVLAPYRSAGEYGFNRGAGITWQRGRTELTLFGSYNKFSGHLNASHTAFTSFLTSGYYRSAGELANRYNLSDLSAGAVLKYAHSNWNLALNTVSHRFSLPLQKASEPFNRYALSGRNAFNSSIDYALTVRNVHSFGEAAIDKQGHTAWVAGLIAALAQSTDFTLLYRNIQKEYSALFGNAFTESSTPQNEQGLYLGLVHRLGRHWTFRGYADFYKFPGIRYLVSAPASGNEELLQLEYQQNPRSSYYIQLRGRNKPADVTGATRYVQTQFIPSVRLAASQTLNRHLKINARLEWLGYRHGSVGETGSLALLEALWSQARWTIDGRLQYFRTGSYNSRLYAYESNVLYAGSSGAFFNNGWRYYVNLKVRSARKLSCWIRWAQTRYLGVSEIGSGLDKVKGNTTTQLSFQTVYTF